MGMGRWQEDSGGWCLGEDSQSIELGRMSALSVLSEPLGSRYLLNGSGATQACSHSHSIMIEFNQILNSVSEARGSSTLTTPEHLFAVCLWFPVGTRAWPLVLGLSLNS